MGRESIVADAIAVDVIGVVDAIAVDDATVVALTAVDGDAIADCSIAGDAIAAVAIDQKNTLERLSVHVS